MRRSLALLLLAPLAVHAVSLGTVRVNKGMVGLACISFGEDVSAAVMTARVYKTPPVAGVGGTLLFEKAMQPATGPVQGLADPASYIQCIPLEALDVAVPAVALKGEIDVVYGDGTNLAQQFTFAIDG